MHDMPNRENMGDECHSGMRSSATDCVLPRAMVQGFAKSIFMGILQNITTMRGALYLHINVHNSTIYPSQKSRNNSNVHQWKNG